MGACISTDVVQPAMPIVLAKPTEIAAIKTTTEQPMTIEDISVKTPKPAPLSPRTVDLRALLLSAISLESMSNLGVIYTNDKQRANKLLLCEITCLTNIRDSSIMRYIIANADSALLELLCNNSKFVKSNVLANKGFVECMYKNEHFDHNKNTQSLMNYILEFNLTSDLEYMYTYNNQLIDSLITSQYEKGKWKNETLSIIAKYASAQLLKRICANITEYDISKAINNNPNFNKEHIRICANALCINHNNAFAHISNFIMYVNHSNIQPYVGGILNKIYKSITRDSLYVGRHICTMLQYLIKTPDIFQNHVVILNKILVLYLDTFNGYYGMHSDVEAVANEYINIGKNTDSCTILLAKLLRKFSPNSTERITRNENFKLNPRNSEFEYVKTWIGHKFVHDLVTKCTSELLDDFYKNTVSECQICNDMRAVYEIQCGHSMCISCKDGAVKLNNLCPFCRTQINIT
jgi:hypothetical protein